MVNLSEYLDRLSRGIYFNNPLQYVLDVFSDPQNTRKGVVPDQWQADTLDLINKHDQVAVASGHGCGKGHSIDTLTKRCIINPDGKAISLVEIRVGDMKVGDYVFGSDGTPTKITGTNRYRRMHYLVTFDDGSSVEVSGEHEWAVRGRQERRKKVDGWRILETQQILDIGVQRPNGTSMAKQWEIPIQGAAQFAEADQRVHPYFMGLWLGDGCRNLPVFTKPFSELHQRIRDVCGYDITVYPGSKGQTRVLKGGKGFMDDPVFQRYSYERYIPDQYKHASVEQRMELFRGLCDSDGEVHNSGSIGYSSASKQLTEDVIWLARSLGCKAMMQPAIKKPFYTKEDGTKVEGRLSYRITINAPFNPFTHPERKAKWKPSGHRYLARWIESIEPTEIKDGMCIEVEAEDHLYQTEDFHVTHNSALSSWIIHWFLATRDHPQIVVTANTAAQLSGKTWRELKKWNNYALNGDYFKWTATKFMHRGDPDTWFAQAVPWSEQNSEAFAGTHETTGVLLLFDEASAIADMIYEVAAGAMTTEGAKWVLFGNPTRNTGRFRECFAGGNEDHRWRTMQVDSRKVRMTDKNRLKEWADDYGEDSDFYRVRVRGEFPRQSTSQFISGDDVDKAMMRGLEPREFYLAPKVLGVDVAKGSDSGNRHAICRRQGRRMWSPVPLTGIDTMELVARITEEYNTWGAQVVCVDGTGVGTGVVHRLQELGYTVVDVMVGSQSTDPVQYANLRTELWGRMRDWLKQDVQMDTDPNLKKELISPEYDHTGKMQVRLEPKKHVKARLGESPDLAESAILTFAADILNASQYVALPVASKATAIGWWTP